MTRSGHNFHVEGISTIIEGRKKARIDGTQVITGHDTTSKLTSTHCDFMTWAQLQ